MTEELFPNDPYLKSCEANFAEIFNGGVTGGLIGEAKSRLDFDLPDTSLDKEQINADLNRLIEENYHAGFSPISDEELASNPELVRTISVKPLSGSGLVRVVDIEDADLQPCGGTHVARTGEIGPVRLGKVEKKGRQNRRVSLHLGD